MTQEIRWVKSRAGHFKNQYDSGDQARYSSPTSSFLLLQVLSSTPLHLTFQLSAYNSIASKPVFAAQSLISDSGTYIWISTGLICLTVLNAAYKFTLKLNELYFLTPNFGIFIFLVSYFYLLHSLDFLKQKRGKNIFEQIWILSIATALSLFSSGRNAAPKVLASRSHCVGLWAGSNFLRAMHIENHTLRKSHLQCVSSMLSTHFKSRLFGVRMD